MLSLKTCWTEEANMGREKLVDKFSADAKLYRKKFELSMKIYRKNLGIGGLGNLQS